MKKELNLKNTNSQALMFQLQIHLGSNQFGKHYEKKEKKKYFSGVILRIWVCTSSNTLNLKGLINWPILQIIINFFKLFIWIFNETVVDSFVMTLRRQIGNVKTHICAPWFHSVALVISTIHEIAVFTITEEDLRGRITRKKRRKE